MSKPDFDMHGYLIGRGVRVAAIDFGFGVRAMLQCNGPDGSRTEHASISVSTSNYYGNTYDEFAIIDGRHAALAAAREFMASIGVTDYVGEA